MNTNPITPTKHDTTPVNTVAKTGGTTGNEKKDKVAPELVNKLMMDSAMGAKLRDIAKDPATWKKEVEKVIGKTGLDEKGLEAARQKMLKGFETGDFSFLNVHVVPDGDARLGKGAAAYAGGDDKSKDGIYISESVAKDPAKLGEAFFEELGHWVDDQARAKGGDAKGDEGERFMHHLAGTPSPLSAMSENDHSKAKIEGKEVDVENNDANRPPKTNPQIPIDGGNTHTKTDDYLNLFSTLEGDLDFNGSVDGGDRAAWKDLVAGINKKDPKALKVANYLLDIGQRYQTIMNYNNNPQSKTTANNIKGVNSNKDSIRYQYDKLTQDVYEINKLKYKGIDIDLSGTSKLVSAYRVASIEGKDVGGGQKIQGSTTQNTGNITSIIQDVKLYVTLRNSLLNSSPNINGMNTKGIANNILDNIDSANRDAGLLVLLQTQLFNDMDAAAKGGASRLEIATAIAKGLGKSDLKNAKDVFSAESEFLNGIKGLADSTFKGWSKTLGDLNKSFNKNLDKENKEAIKAKFKNKLDQMFTIVSILGGATSATGTLFGQYSSYVTRVRNVNKVKTINYTPTKPGEKAIDNKELDDLSKANLNDFYKRHPSIQDKDKPDYENLANANDALRVNSALFGGYFVPNGFDLASSSMKLKELLKDPTKSKSAIKVDLKNFVLQESVKKQISLSEGYQSYNAQAQESIKNLLKIGAVGTDKSTTFKSKNDGQEDANKRLKDLATSLGASDVDSWEANGDVYDTGEYYIYARAEVEDAGDQGQDTVNLTMWYEKKPADTK